MNNNKNYEHRTTNNTEIHRTTQIRATVTFYGFSAGHNSPSLVCNPKVHVRDHYTRHVGDPMSHFIT
jgi:hypothetical protein